MKKPHLPISSSVGRALAELAVIVAGVLIALAAQSWWEGRGEATERRVALQALEDDLALIETRMLADSASITEMGAALRMVLDEPERLVELSDSALADDLRLVFWNTVLGNSQYPFPAWDDLQSSGRLDLLPDSVRRSLSDLNQLLERFYFATADLQGLQVQRIDPLIPSYFDGRELLWTPQLGIRHGNRPSLAFLEDRQLMTFAVMKLSILDFVRGNLEPALRQVRTVRGLIR